MRTTIAAGYSSVLALPGCGRVSGRSDLTWEESVRLDLRYVENWSLGQDALIMWKTPSAVFTGSGRIRRLLFSAARRGGGLIARDDSRCDAGCDSGAAGPVAVDG
jgi:hypothetical protein